LVSTEALFLCVHVSVGPCEAYQNLKLARNFKILNIPQRKLRKKFAITCFKYKCSKKGLIIVHGHEESCQNLGRLK
jgi:hypothetical protein